jgi:hypothetical protein
MPSGSSVPGKPFLGGALIVADDINLPSMGSYLEYIRNPANGYATVSFPVEDGMEISCWAGRAT